MKETAGASKVSDEVMTNVVFVVRREVCMLTKIERREKWQKLRCVCLQDYRDEC